MGLKNIVILYKYSKKERKMLLGIVY